MLWLIYVGIGIGGYLWIDALLKIAGLLKEMYAEAQLRKEVAAWKAGR
jgi:hypothetical protein